MVVMKKSIMLVGFGVLLLLLWIGIFSLNNDSPDPGKEIAALVNGEAIYVEDIEKELGTVSVDQRHLVNQAKTLEFLLERKLLLQEANAQGVTVSQDDIDELYRNFASSSSFNLEYTEAAIAAQNLTIDEFLHRLEEQAIINKLIDQQIQSAFVLTNSEVQKFYDDNYQNSNLSFEEVETEILLFLADVKNANTRTAYINTLKLQADIVVLLDI